MELTLIGFAVIKATTLWACQLQTMTAGTKSSRNSYQTRSVCLIGLLWPHSCSAPLSMTVYFSTECRATDFVDDTHVIVSGWENGVSNLLARIEHTLLSLEVCFCQPYERQKLIWWFLAALHDILSFEVQFREETICRLMSVSNLGVIFDTHLFLDASQVI